MAFVGSTSFFGLATGRVRTGQRIVRSQRGKVWMVQPGIQIGRPKTQIGRPKTSVTSPTTPSETEMEKEKKRAKPKYKTESDEIPLYKVILLGDEGYDEVHVTTQLTKIIPKLGSDESSRIFGEAQSTGSAIVCVVAKEHAEFYAQQLRRQEIFVVVEEDN